jgi:TonB-linked SusC/RagA family outer membrane protein
MNHICRKVIAICWMMFLAFHPPAAAQQKKEDKVTINIRNGTLEEIIQAIRKQTAVKIVYNQELVKRSPRLSLISKDEPLNGLMKRLLKGTALTFIMQEDVMIIAPKEEQEENQKKYNIIKGVVTDDLGNPIQLVTVSINGIANSTLTDEKGKFTIRLEEGNILTFSSVGYKRKTVTPQQGEILKVSLASELKEMEEVVVTGYQEVNKRLSASSTVTLKGDEVKENGATNIVAMLQGKVVGLDVVKNSGSPNAIPTMRMRGTSTIIGNANPIIVVDGMVRENPNDLNPENLMGISPSGRDLLLMQQSILATGSLTGNGITGLNVNDVESITFLKDASATAIYGTRAANGVIVITTKKGKNGMLQMNYSSAYGLSFRPKYSQLELMNSQQRVQFSREMYEDGYLYKSFPVKMGYEGVFQDLINRKITETEFQTEVNRVAQLNTDWFKVLFRNSFNNNQHFSFSGGTEKTSYYASVSYNGNSGVAKKDNYQDGSTIMRLSSELSRKLKFNMGLNASYRASTGYYGQNPLQYALTTSRAISSDLFYPSTTEILPGIDTAPFNFNMVHDLEETGNSIKDTKVSANMDLSYLLTRGLKLTSAVMGSFTTQRAEQYATELSSDVSSRRGYEFGSVAPGSAQELASIIPFGGILAPTDQSQFSYNIRNSADFNRSVFNENNQINILVGHEIRSSRNMIFNNLIPGYFRNRGENFSLVSKSLELVSPKKTNTVSNAMSVFGTATYSYAGKYILNGNIRTDASNRFGQFANQRFLPVWSVAGRWNLGSENWLKDSKVISDLYVRGSYGFQGNVITNVGPDLILTMGDLGSAFNPAANEYFLQIKSFPYPDLRWEKTRSVNLDLGGALFNSAVTFNLNHYRKLTTDAIVAKSIPLEYGLPTMLINGGNIKNYGYEIELGFNLIRKKELNWRMGINGARNFNRLQQGTIDNVNINIYDYFNGRALIEGMPIGTLHLFRFKGLHPETGVPLFYGIDDETRDQTKTKFIQYLTSMGSRDAKINGGLNTNVSYKAFSLGMNFSYKLGGVKLKNPIYGNTVNIPMPETNLPVAMAERWRKPGDENHTNIPSYPRPLPDSAPGNANVRLPAPSGQTIGDVMNRYLMYNYSDINLISASFLRCNNIDFSYRLPNNLVKRLRVKGISVSASAGNLFVIADKKWKGQDPEVDGAGVTALPISKMYNMSLNVNF